MPPGSPDGGPRRPAVAGRWIALAALGALALGVTALLLRREDARPPSASRQEGEGSGTPDSVLARGAPPAPVADPAVPTKAQAAAARQRPADPSPPLPPAVAPSPSPSGGTLPAGGSTAASEETRRAIVEAMRLARPAVIECYHKELESNPDMGGKLVVDFVVTPGRDDFGHIEEAEVSDSSFRHPLFEQCVLNGLAKVQFPQPPRDEPLKISYPLRFAPRAAPGAPAPGAR